MTHEEGYEIALEKINEAAKDKSHDLDLSGLNLTQLPPEVFELTDLQRLLLYGNKFTSLPESIGNLTNLIELNLHSNQLTELPESIGNLINLQGLDLEGNQLIALPEFVGNLASLEVLDLSNTQLRSIPDWLEHLHSLSTLHLHRNSSLGFPSELLGSTAYELIDENYRFADPADIIEYAKRINSNSRALNEAKLILVGKGAVGKSSLVEKLKYGTFIKGKEKTEGINIERWKLPLKGDDILLNVWDFGGQEIMHATHQFFLTERSLYLLVLNGREGSEDLEAEYWLKLIAGFGGNSPVIIVLNKIREHAFDLNRSALLEKYPNIKDFVRTDCEDDESIAELKKAIERETDLLDELRVKFPGEWFSIKDALAEMDRNYLDFAEYRRLCSDHGVINPRHQEMLAKYLNQLGIVLNYRDDARLKDTHVLNPHWVTKGIYKVLNSPLLEENNGEIKLGDITKILAEADYPAFMCRFMFDLMKKFDLCFTFPDDDSHYLIPELLPKNQPDAVKKFVPEQCLNFQYHYRVLPEGLLPRFITRTHFLSDKEPRWRSGVILKFENCRALVKADIAERKVFVSVMGENADSRRRLLTVVRSDLERIHSEIKNLDPVQMVPLPDHPTVLIPYTDLEVMEKNDVDEFTRVVGDKVKIYKVKELLHGIDLPKYSVPASRKGRDRTEVDVFISYAHKDEIFKNALEAHLKILQNQNLIRTWNDDHIGHGDDLNVEIDKRLESAEIVLLLVSSDYMASHYCYNIEMPRALERKAKDGIKVIPVIVRDCHWHSSLFGKLKALPKDGKAVDLWPNRDTALTEVSIGIEKAAKAWLEKKKKQESDDE